MHINHISPWFILNLSWNTSNYLNPKFILKTSFKLVPLILSEATLLLIITLPSTLFSKTLFTLQIFSKPLSLTSLKLSLIYPTVFSKLYLSQLVTLSITKIILNFSKSANAKAKIRLQDTYGTKLFPLWFSRVFDSTFEQCSPFEIKQATNKDLQ